jgi:tetratricopeptide (TPR) repeat protein
LRQIETERPPPLRSLNPTVSRDLETIVNASIAKYPHDRYQSVRELRDDLRRFVEHEPIRARRPRFRERLSRWLQTHPALATTLLILLGVSTLGFMTVSWQWHRANVFLAESRQQTQRAERERQRAETAETQQRLLADQQARVAQKAVETIQLMTDLMQQGKVVERSMFTALDGMTGGTSDNTQRKLASIRLRNAWLMLQAGRHTDAITEYAEGGRLTEQLLHDDENNVSLQHSLIHTYISLGYVLTAVDRTEEGVEQYQRGLALLQEFPDHERDRRWQDVYARARHNLGFAWVKLRQFDRATVAYDEVAKIRESLAQEADDGNSAAATERLAQTYNDIAFLFEKRHMPRRALEFNLRALELRRTLTKQDRKNPDHMLSVATSLNHLADVHRGTLNFPSAIVRYEESLDVYKLLLARNPDVPSYRFNFGNTLENLGEVLMSRKDYRQAVSRFDQAALVYSRLLRVDEDNTSYRNWLAVSQRLGATSRMYLREDDLATELFDAALTNFLVCCTTNPTYEGYRRQAHKTATVFSRFLLLRNQPDAAIEVWERCLSRVADHPRLLSDTAWLYLTGPEKFRDYDRAVVLAADATKISPNSPSILRTFALAQYQTGQFREALATAREHTDDISMAMGIQQKFLQALCFDALNQAESATEVYDQAIRNLIDSDAISTSEELTLNFFHALAIKRLGRSEFNISEIEVQWSQIRRDWVRYFARLSSQFSTMFPEFE